MDMKNCKCDICNLVNSFKLGVKDKHMTNQEGRNANAEFLLDQVMDIVSNHHAKVNDWGLKFSPWKSMPLWKK